MVDGKKHKGKSKPDDSAEMELDDATLFRIKNFYSCDTLSDDIVEFVTSKYEKEFTPMDAMNVAIFTLHRIISASASNDSKLKDVVKSKLCDMVDDAYNLNEWIFTTAYEVRAKDETIYECIKSGNTDDIDAKVDKAVKEANYKAWKDELKVIKRKTSAKDRIAEIKGGA